MAASQREISIRLPSGDICKFRRRAAAARVRSEIQRLVRACPQVNKNLLARQLTSQ